MTPEDQVAFEKFCEFDDICDEKFYRMLQRQAFKAALAHRDVQASAINEQMLEVLKDCRDEFKELCSKGVGFYLILNPIVSKVENTITAAESHKEPKC